MALTPGFKAGPHWREARALTTVPPLVKQQQQQQQQQKRYSFYVDRMA